MQQKELVEFCIGRLKSVYSLRITNPNSEPYQISLTSGKMVIGRMVNCDIVINDTSASRRHAEIFYDLMTGMVTINDLNSSNGTYVNRQRIARLSRLQNGDVIRIGQTVMYLTRITDTPTDRKGIAGTHLFTRELVLEAVDEHPITLNEITEELNTVADVDSAVNLVKDLIKRSLGADVCEIILARDFGKLAMGNADNLMVRAIRNSSVEAGPLALCVPVMSGQKPFALIYLEKKSPGGATF